MPFFYDFFKIFKNLDLKKLKNLKDLNPVVGNCGGLLSNMTAQILVVFEM